MDAVWPPDRLGETEVKYEIFNTTEKGDHELSYREIEVYARVVEVPSALLLLISRCISNYERAGLGAVDGVLEPMEQACDAIRRHAEAGTLKSFDSVWSVIQAYEAHPKSRDGNPGHWNDPG
jgi:hypothetical protein